MSQSPSNIRSTREMETHNSKGLVDKLYKELHSLKWAAIIEFYDEYREDMRGCLWKFPNPNDKRGLIWIPINQTLKLPSLDGFSRHELEELGMSLQDKRVQVRCLTPLEHKSYEDGWGFDGPIINHDIRYRLMNTIERTLGKPLGIRHQFDPRYPPGQTGVRWRFKHHYSFPQPGFSEWTDEQIHGCNTALTHQDLRVELVPDSQWRRRCLLGSINSKLSCATDLYKTKSLSVSDAEELFLQGPTAIGWRWYRTENCPNIFPTLKDTDIFDLQRWQEADLQAIDKTIERGWLYVEPIEDIYKDKGPPKSSSNSKSSDGKTNAEIHQIPRLKHPSSPSSSSPKHSSSLDLSSCSSNTTSNPLALGDNRIVLCSNISPAISNIQEEFIDVQNQIFNKLLEQNMVEVTKSLEGHYIVQMDAVKTKLHEMTQEKIALERQHSALQDQLEKISSKLKKSVDDFAAKNVNTKNLMDSLSDEIKERERTDRENLALREKGTKLQMELDESILANSILSREIEDLTVKIEGLATEKNKAEAIALEFRKKFEASTLEAGDRLDKMSQMVAEADRRKLELEENEKLRESEMSELRQAMATMETAISTARTEGERAGREIAIRDLQFAAEKTWEGIQRGHLDHIQSVRAFEYKRGLEDGQDTKANDKRLQSLAIAAIIEQKDTPTGFTPPAQDKPQNLYEQSFANSAGHTLTASEQVEHCTAPPTPTKSPVGDFNVDDELGLLTQSPGCEIVPSKLCEFNHTFLREFVGGSDIFWNDMQLTLDFAEEKSTKINLVGWRRILKVHDNREPYPNIKQRPSIGKHGALLLVSELDDNAIHDMSYPTFLNTVEGHAVYMGQYKVVKRHINRRNQFKSVFCRYLLKATKGIKFVQAKTRSINRNQDRDTIRMSRLDSAFNMKDGVRTSWTVLQFVGFDLESYETLVKQYSQTDPFSWKGCGLPLQDVDGGFEHHFLNDLLGALPTKRTCDADDEGENPRKRLRLKLRSSTSSPKNIQPAAHSTNDVDKSQRTETPGIQSLQQEEEDALTIVVDHTSRLR